MFYKIVHNLIAILPDKVGIQRAIWGNQDNLQCSIASYSSSPLCNSTVFRTIPEWNNCPQPLRRPFFISVWEQPEPKALSQKQPNICVLPCSRLCKLSYKTQKWIRVMRCQNKRTTLKASISLNNGISINGEYVTNIRYADDAVLIANSPNNLQKMLGEVVMKSREKGLRLNIKKTECMTVSKNPNKALSLDLKKWGRRHKKCCINLDI